MIRENFKRDTAVFYTCGTCNLNCRYCNIDKNPILTEIDKKLEESFQGDYYFNRLKAYFPHSSMLRNLETWGGEPFLHMERIYPLLRKIINEYPYFNKMFSSTNFSYDTWTDQFFGLMDVFGEFPDRYFNFTLQLSIDGPEEINDANRGKGVTQKCLKNYNKFIQLISEDRLPKNITLNIAMKGTLDLDNIRILQDKQTIIDYYKFFEDNYIIPLKELNQDRVFIGAAVPNVAVPSPVTVNDGHLFANLCKLCREIEQENQNLHYFKYYIIITPFSYGSNCVNCNAGYESQIWGCGSGVNVIGFLPDDTVTACHEGFIEIVNRYKDYAKNRNLDNIVINFNTFLDDYKINLRMTDDQYIKHEEKMKTFIDPHATAQLASNTTLIIALAMAKQVDSKYLDEATARMAAIYFQTNCAFCIKDNYSQTGSYTMSPTGLYKLLLNGALDYIWKGGNDGCC